MFAAVAGGRSGGVLVFLACGQARGDELRGPDNVGVAAGQQNEVLGRGGSLEVVQGCCLIRQFSRAGLGPHDKPRMPERLKKAWCLYRPWYAAGKRTTRAPPLPRHRGDRCDSSSGTSMRGSAWFSAHERVISRAR